MSIALFSSSVSGSFSRTRFLLPSAHKRLSQISCSFLHRWSGRDCPCAFFVRAMAELVEEKELTEGTTRASKSGPVVSLCSGLELEVGHSWTFLDVQSEEELLSDVRKEIEAGRLPLNVAATMEEVYQNYPNAATFSQALYPSVSEQYNVLKSAIYGNQGLDASNSIVFLSQPWK